ncbi:hypothetical protein B0H15DRAFT_956183 [Mycena belliarum]|uniref:Uncharacterized protein n=1 Tax=Mycena belliarum TaxID=1033014 RepID=A0AAD6TQ47_9AGAR|nr:hypothetical protein B0H15DRAFT_956183 [Mycena belliae]
MPREVSARCLASSTHASVTSCPAAWASLSVIVAAVQVVTNGRIANFNSRLAPLLNTL